MNNSRYFLFRDFLILKILMFNQNQKSMKKVSDFDDVLRGCVSMLKRRYSFTAQNPYQNKQTKRSEKSKIIKLKLRPNDHCQIPIMEIILMTLFACIQFSLVLIGDDHMAFVIFIKINKRADILV